MAHSQGSALLQTGFLFEVIVQERFETGSWSRGRPLQSGERSRLHKNAIPVIFLRSSQAAEAEHYTVARAQEAGSMLALKLWLTSAQSLRYLVRLAKACSVGLACWSLRAPAIVVSEILLMTWTKVWGPWASPMSVSNPEVLEQPIGRRISGEHRRTHGL